MLIKKDYFNKKKQLLVEEFINNLSKKKYILGRNKWSSSVSSVLQIDGIIDDFTLENKFENLPIYKMVDIKYEDCIVLSVTMGSPKTAQIRLDKLGINNVDYFSFFKYSKLNILLPPFICDFQENYNNNKNKYDEVYENLADEKSKNIFNKIINFKKTFDLDFMMEFENNSKLQYLEDDFFVLPSNYVFIDGGGYIGDTTFNVIEKYPNYKKIYLFEPVYSNIIKAKDNLKKYKNIEYIEAGLTNFEGDICFEEDDSSSSISQIGNSKIKVNYIDNIISEDVDFIKFDIEGSELDALNGAKNLISKYRPILAICIYHKAEDWYKIPEIILEMYGEYKIYLRHYMEGIFETVMYFIPPKNSRNQYGI